MYFFFYFLWIQDTNIADMHMDKIVESDAKRRDNTLVFIDLTGLKQQKGKAKSARAHAHTHTHISWEREIVE